MPSTVMSTTSPGFRKICGVRPKPTPGGEPVVSTSPGSKGYQREKNAINAGTVKIKSEVCADCIGCPFNVDETEMLCGSGISSLVAITGPIGQNVGNCLPMRFMSRSPGHSDLRETSTQSRADTSLTIV